jgi:hypothetical protein
MTTSKGPTTMLRTLELVWTLLLFAGAVVSLANYHDALRDWQAARLRGVPSSLVVAVARRDARTHLTAAVALLLLGVGLGAGFVTFGRDLPGWAVVALTAGTVVLTWNVVADLRFRRTLAKARSGRHGDT